MEIYTDCSFLEKEGIAGIGILINDGQKQRSFSNWILSPSVNYGELFAIYEACVLTGGKPATVYSDSQTALDFIHRRIRLKSREEFKNQDQYCLHKQMHVLAYKIRNVNPNIAFEKVKAHRKDYRVGHLNNSMADLLAKRGVSKFFGR